MASHCLFFFFLPKADKSKIGHVLYAGMDDIQMEGTT